MDPDKTLEELLELANAVLSGTCPEGFHECDAGDALEMQADQLAEGIQNLHEWISGGGFLPAKWQAARTATAKKQMKYTAAAAAEWQALLETAEDERQLKQVVDRLVQEYTDLLPAQIKKMRIRSLLDWADEHRRKDLRELLDYALEVDYELMMDQSQHRGLGRYNK